MSSTDLRSTAPPSTPVNAEPPTETPLRSDRTDWLLVGYTRRPETEPTPATDSAVSCADPAELPAFVARWRIRDSSGDAAPELRLAPQLRDRFVEALVATGALSSIDDAADGDKQIIATAGTGGLPGTSRGPHVVQVDGRPVDTQTNRDPVGEFFAEDLVKYGLPLEGKLRDLNHLIEVETARRLLFVPGARAGGYMYVITRHDRAAREKRGEPFLEALVSETPLRLAKRVGALTEPAAEVLAYFRRYVGNRYPDAGNVLPSEAEFAEFLNVRGIAVPPAVPAPDPKLAERIADFIEDEYQERGQGPTQKRIVSKMRRRKEAVIAALAWLQVQGRSKLVNRGPQGQHEYIPGDK